LTRCRLICILIVIITPCSLLPAGSALATTGSVKGKFSWKEVGEGALNSSSANPGMVLDHVFNLVNTFGGN